MVRSKTLQDYNLDDLVKIEYGGHIWEFGHFGAFTNGGYSAYGFRQDGTIIRVTSKYETEFLCELLNRIIEGEG